MAKMATDAAATAPRPARAAAPTSAHSRTSSALYSVATVNFHSAATTRPPKRRRATRTTPSTDATTRIGLDPFEGRGSRAREAEPGGGGVAVAPLSPLSFMAMWGQNPCHVGHRASASRQQTHLE